MMYGATKKEPLNDRQNSVDSTIPCAHPDCEVVMGQRVLEGVRKSRDIIWQHAGAYRWQRHRNWHADPCVDRFVRPVSLTVMHYARNNCELLVRYTHNGRVVRAITNRCSSQMTTRNEVLDELEWGAQRVR